MNSTMKSFLKLSIVTWNIGNNMNRNKLEELKVHLRKQKNIDIYFLCLQEFDGKNESLLKEVLNYDVIKIGSVGSAFLKFQVSSFALIKKHSLLIDFSVQKKEYGLGTKGFIVTNLDIRNKITNEETNLVIVNSHFPFNKKLDDWYIQMNDLLKTLENAETDNIFLCGDLNSRSLFTKDCYSKDVTATDSFNRVKDILSNYDIRSSPVRSRSKLKTAKLLECVEGVGIVNENKYLSSCDSLKNKKCKQELVSFLVSSDFLKKQMISGKILSNFQEGQIKFLPTYKFDKSNGKYSLKKKKKNRLPGYPDRILFNKKGIMRNTKYVSLPIKGNDHIPLIGNFIIKMNISLESIKSKVDLKESNIKKTKKLKRKRIKETVKKKIITCCILDRKKIQDIYTGNEF